MKFHTGLIAIGSAALISGSALAAVYKSVDAQGNVVYTDEPQGNAQPLNLPPLSTIPAPKNFKRAPAKVTPKVVDSYEQIRIVSPAQDDTVRDNSGNVAVSAALKPALNKAAGDRLQFYLDGQTEGKPRSGGRTVLQGLDRGAHTLEAAVIDRSGKELKRSPAIRFYLHRQSVNFPKGPGRPGGGGK